MLTEQQGMEPNGQKRKNEPNRQCLFCQLVQRIEHFSFCPLVNELKPRRKKGGIMFLQLFFSLIKVLKYNRNACVCVSIPLKQKKLPLTNMN